MCKSVKLYFVCLMALILSGCGAGATSGDPLGTDSIAASASETSLVAGQSSLITATVTNATGDPVPGRSVSFTLRTNNSGGTLGVLNNETKGNGQAMVSYTAGANSPTNSVQDTIQVSISNGSTAAVVITRAAGSVPTDPVISQLSATPDSIDPGHISIIVAEVSDTAGNPVSSETVTFTIPVNNTGSTLSSFTGTTDNDGKVVTVYSPGNASPTDSVDDAVQATIPNGSSRIVVITRTGTSGTGYAVTLTANPSGFEGGWTGKTVSSILTATVTDSLSQVVSGMMVTFSIESGGGAFSSATAVTDGSGKAVVSYTKTVNEPAGTTIIVLLKATLPDGTETMITMRIDA